MTDTTFLTPFDFQENQVRTAIDAEGNEWFCAVDVAEILGIEWRARQVQNLKETWHTLLNHYDPSGTKQAVYIRTPAVYKMAFSSDKPEAIEFANWVCEEVIPSIKTNGSYGTISIEQELKCTMAISKLIKDIQHTKDAFAQPILHERLKRICHKIGQPLPDIKNLGKEIEQIELF